MRIPATKLLSSKKIFSASGARRGLWIAVIFLVLWLAWFYGYVQGLETATQMNHSFELNLQPIYVNK
jgi:hypothetical protein